jgi:curved DNA-binding protein CbpA
MSADPYQVLGIPVDATLEEIRKAYISLLGQYKNDPKKRQELDDAYLALKDPNTRQLGDLLRKSNAAQNEIWNADLKNTEQYADYLGNLNKNLGKTARALQSEKPGRFTSTKAQIAFWVGVIGFIASLLGIISFYLDYLSK